MIDGNGRKGLNDEVTILKEKVNIMEESLECLATSYKSLVNSQIESDVTEKLKIELANKRHKLIASTAAIIGAASVIITAMITFA